jgi:nitroreductase
LKIWSFNTLDTLEAILTRRSVRTFTPDPVSDEEMETLIQAAAAAPSGGNAQARLFLSVRQPQRIAALRSLAPGIIGIPPAIIVLCLDRKVLPLNDAFSPSLHYDIGTSLENILLAAHAVGLGACPVASFHARGLSTFLNLPEDVEPCLLVVVGKPRFTPSAPPKRSLAEIYFHESYEGRRANT